MGFIRCGALKRPDKAQPGLAHGGRKRVPAKARLLAGTASVLVIGSAGVVLAPAAFRRSSRVASASKPGERG